MQELHFRSGYARSKEGLLELTRLIVDVFGVDVSPLDRLGHDPSVAAFGWWHNDTLVANVSLYERRLWLAGEPVTAFGVQSVAVRPEWRGKGLFRDLIQRGLDYADARTELILLRTDTPDLYRPFGFRPIAETIFSSNLARRQARTGYRELSLGDDGDVGLLRALFSRRAPTSMLASACDHPALFLLKATLTPDIKLLHLMDLDAVVAVMGQGQPTLTLLDIVAPSIPPLDAIVAALDFGGERIEVHMTPDRLSWVPEKERPVDNGHMVRGRFAPEGRAFILSRMHA